MIPLKEESRASSSDENTSLLDDDDSIADTDDDEEENSLAVRVGGGLSIETQQPCGQGPQQPAPSAMIDSNTSHRNRVSTATPQKYRPPARIVSSSSSGQLSFDMNQPWERSLARQLDQLVCDDEDYYRPGYMFVGHTESTDFMLPVDQDDAVSLGTSVSSTLPSKNQLVHRSLLMRGLKPGGENTMDTSGDNSQGKRHVRRESAGSQITTASEDERDDTAKSPIRDHLLALIEEQRRKSTPDPSPYLELEPSTNADDESIQYFVNNDYIPSLPDPACFCLGYNVFDVVLPPLSRSSRVTNSRRRSMVRRNSKLFRVDEGAESKQTLSPTRSGTAYSSNADRY